MNMDVIVSLCKRRGFIFQSSEIYGGLGSAWDYGPLGVELKRNVKNLWWRDNIQLRSDMVGLDAAITMHPNVWKASGHADNFADPFVACRECQRNYRADHVADANHGRVLGQFVPTTRTALGAHDAGPLEVAEHLLEEAGGDSLAVADVLDLRGAPGGVERQVEHRLQAVATLVRELHRRMKSTNPIGNCKNLLSTLILENFVSNRFSACTVTKNGANLEGSLRNQSRLKQYQCPPGAEWSVRLG